MLQLLVAVWFHNLGSHPQIDGYCETHIKYRTRFDLLRLRSRVVKADWRAPARPAMCWKRCCTTRHSRRAFCAAPRTFAIVLVSKPIPAVQEYPSIWPALWGCRVHRDLDTVVRYYEERLATLVRLADELRGRVMFMEAETHACANERTFCTASAACWI